MEHRSIAKRSISPAHHHQRRLNEDNRVAWSKQQTAKSRQKRDFTRLKPKSISKLLNDPKWSSMWYLNVSIIDILKLSERFFLSAHSDETSCKLCRCCIQLFSLGNAITTKYHSQLNCFHLFSCHKCHLRTVKK